MKLVIQKLWSLMAMLCLSISASAYDFTVNGIYYNFIDATKHTVEVTSNNNKYMGDMVIPSEVQYNAQTYSVTSIGSNAFSNCLELTSITIPNSVTSIGYYAFYGCKRLKSVIIPPSVTSIGSRAFCECYGLTSVTIPDSVTLIGTAAFCECYGLTSVTIPNSVTSIGSYAFYACSGLMSVSISNSVTSIASSTFSNCRSLNSVIIPNSVTSIGEDAFAGCTGMISVIISNSTTLIGKGAFSGCSGLTSVNIPSSVTEIGRSAFESCTGLTSVIIPNSVSSIGDYAFYYCSGLTSVIIGNSVTSIGNDAFEGCNKLIKSAYPFSISNPFSCGRIISYNPNGSMIEDGFLYGPDKTSILFVPLSLNGEYTIPSSITVIGSQAFYGCDSLKSVTMTADKAPNLADNAFEGLYDTITLSFPQSALYSYLSSACSLFKSIKFTGSEVNIGHYSDGVLDYLLIGAESDTERNIAFVRKGEYGPLTSVTIPERFTADDLERYYVTGICGTAFKNCKNLKDIIFHSKSVVSSIGNAAFEGTPIGTISLPTSVSYIGKGAFKNSSLNSFSIPNSVVTIEDETFYGCSNLRSFEIPTWIKMIGRSAFAWCNNLNTITIPNTVTSIGDRIFYNCSKLTTINIPNSVTSIGDNTFYNCSSLTSVIIPNSVTSIGTDAFTKCSNLRKSAYPNTLANPFSNGFAVAYDPQETTIENGFMYGPGKLSILFVPHTLTGKYIIPNSVTSVGASAFAGCSSLSFIEIGSGIKTIADNAFAECSLSKVVIPPAVDNIGNSAFAGNVSLKEVAIGPKVKSIGDKAFDNTPLERVFITAPEPPVAPYSAFSKYTAKLYVQGKAAVDVYYDATSCWDRFEGYVMSEPQSLTMEKPTMIEGKSGEQFTLKATLTPANVDLPYIFWRSTDPEKAYVDNDGKVKVLRDITDDDNVEIIAETLYYNGPIAKFSFSTDNSGVDEIVGDTTSTIDVFTLQGVLVLRNANREQFDNLANGIYIVRNGKDVRKVVK